FDLYVENALARRGARLQLSVDPLDVLILSKKFESILQSIDVQHAPRPGHDSIDDERWSQPELSRRVVRIDALKFHICPKEFSLLGFKRHDRVVRIDLLIRPDHAGRDVTVIDVELRQLDA